jgi:hypothetical protein
LNAHDDQLDEVFRDRLACGGEASRGVSRQAAERPRDRVTDRFEVCLIGVKRGGKSALRSRERSLELGPCAPGCPSVRRCFEHGFNQAEAVTVAVKCGVCLRSWSEKRQTVEIRHNAAPRRTKGEIRTAGDRDAERLPVQASVQESEIVCVNVDEDSTLVENGKIERQPLNRGSRSA